MPLVHGTTRGPSRLPNAAHIGSCAGISARPDQARARRCIGKCRMGGSCRPPPTESASLVARLAQHWRVPRTDVLCTRALPRSMALALDTGVVPTVLRSAHAAVRIEFRVRLPSTACTAHLHAEALLSCFHFRIRAFVQHRHWFRRTWNWSSARNSRHTRQNFTVASSIVRMIVPFRVLRRVGYGRLTRYLPSLSARQRRA
jgi:hypothetical protein